ncbi:MAG: FAD-dependent oxidoreductase [Pseudomonadota bacterium]
MTALPRIAVIGAGMAGLACAARLHAAGLEPVVFDKSRGLGGRLATRRADQGRAFDHGAQFATARSPAFKAFMDDAVANGAAAPWQPRGAEDKPADTPWFVGTPGMNGMVKPLAAGLDLRLGTPVTGLVRDGAGWRAQSETSDIAPFFDLVVCTAPAPQASALASALPDMGRALDAVAIAPCWALMLAFAVPFKPGFDMKRLTDGPIALAARTTSKPGRTANQECWVVHGGPDWSRTHLEEDFDTIASRLVAELPTVFGTTAPEPVHAVAHRWRFAQTTTPLGEPFLRSADGTFFAGGDWCLGARVEAAFESGTAIAETILEEQRAQA